MPSSCSRPSLVAIAHGMHAFELQRGKERVQTTEQERIVVCGAIHKRAEHVQYF
jgi:hypothetical protein